MATRMSKGIDTSKLPTTSELLALSTTPGAGEGVDRLATGVTSGLDLADRLATRKLEREKALLAMQETIRKAKEEAAQKQREQALAQEIGGTSPAHTRVAANIGGQPVMAKETRQFQEQAPNRLRATLGAVDPTKTAQDEITRGATETAATTEFGRKQALSTQDFEEAAELERIKAGLKDKGDKKGLSSLLERQLLSSKKGGGLIDQIEQSMNLMSKRTGIVGGAGALKLGAQKMTKGFLGGDPNILAFESLRPTAGKALYKEVSGDVGNISDSEGKMAMDIVPTAFEDPGVRQAKLANLKQFKADTLTAISELRELAIRNNWDEQMYTQAVESRVKGLMFSAAAKGASLSGKKASIESAIEPDEGN